MKRWVEDEDKVNRFCESIKLGMSLKSTCSGMCISQESIYKYFQKAEEQLAQDENANTPEIQFLHLYKKAEREFEMHHLQNIKNFADNGDWKASAWLLERRRQADYVVRQDVNLTTPEKITINMDVKPEL